MTITVCNEHVVVVFAAAIGFLAGRESVWHNIRANLRRARYWCKIDGVGRNMRFNRIDSSVGGEDDGGMMFILEDNND